MARCRGVLRGAVARAAVVVMALVCVAAVAFALGCTAARTTAGDADSPRDAHVIEATAVSTRADWFAVLVQDPELPAALNAAVQDAHIPAEVVAFAEQSAPDVIERYSASGSRQPMETSGHAPITVRTVTMLREPLVEDGGRVWRPVWEGLGTSEVYRVSVFRGSEHVGEYLVYGVAEVIHGDGDYTLAQQGALLRLWRYFGRRGFRYAVSPPDMGMGSWVVGTAQGRVAGVYLGPCSLARSENNLDQRIGSRVEAGRVFDENDLAVTWASIANEGLAR